MLVALPRGGNMMASFGSMAEGMGEIIIIINIAINSIIKLV